MQRSLCRLKLVALGLLAALVLPLIWLNSDLPLALARSQYFE